jgi:hypothetical protein
MKNPILCFKTRRQIEQYCQGLLPPERARRVEDHIRRCPACRREYETTGELLDRLASHKLPDPGEVFWDRMRGAIMGRLAETPARPLPWYKRDWVAPFQWPGYAWATALLLLVLVPLLLYTRYSGQDAAPLPAAMVAEWNLETGSDPMFSGLEGLSQRESERLGKKVVTLLAGEVTKNPAPAEEDDWSWDAAGSLESLNEQEMEAVAKKLKTRYAAG